MDAPERAVSPEPAAPSAPVLTSSILAWHDVTRRYRRPLGGWWWAALVLVPLLLAVISTVFGLGSGGRAEAAAVPSAQTTPSGTTPTATSASETASSATTVAVALVRVGEMVTVTGTFPDEASHQLAIQVPDLSVQLDGTTVTLTGAAATEQTVTAAEHAVSHAYSRARVRSELAAAGAQAVNAAARLLRACPTAGVLVYGHTDGLGTSEGNQKVSQQRADTVKKLLRSAGVTNPITAEGRGGANLIADSSTAAGRAANRRAEISIR